MSAENTIDVQPQTPTKLVRKTFRLTESMHRQVLDVMRREGCTDESEALRRLLYRGLKATAA